MLLDKAEFTLSIFEALVSFFLATSFKLFFALFNFVFATATNFVNVSVLFELDELEIFYLMSRGIPRQKAVQMVVEGFFAPVMRRIPIDGVRDRIAARILEKVG